MPATGSLDPRDATLAAIGDVLRSVARSSFDLTAVLQTVIERAAALTGAEHGNIAVREGGAYRVLAVVGLSDEYAQLARGRLYAAERGSIIGRALLEGRTVHIGDVTADPEYALHDLQRAGGYRTVLGVPLISDGDAIGALAVGRGRVAPFREDELALATFFADQAAVAIRIAGLLAETQEALERERAVSEVLTAISRSAFDLDQVLEEVIARAVTLSHADFGNILRVEDSTGTYRQVARHGPTPDASWEFGVERGFSPSRATLVGRTLLEHRPVQIPDVLADPASDFAEGERLGGYRTILGVPLLREGSPIGVIVVKRREVRPFKEREISLLTTFADQAVLAIENVRLFETVERQRSELARFAPQVASLLSTSEGETLLAGHRREISVLFADLRGFTSFAEAAEPEEVLGVLREYHATAGQLILANGGTVEHFAGDGLMAFYNDPAPLADHGVAAARTAIDLRERFEQLAAGWRRRGYELGLGIGIALGYATLGRIGFEGRYDYGAVGNAVILASRLSDAAAAGEILVSQRFQAAVDGAFAAERMDELQLKGMSRPVPVFRLLADRITG